MDLNIGLHTVPQLHKLTPINAFQQQADCPIVKCSAVPPYELELGNRVTESTQAKAVAREVWWCVKWKNPSNRKIFCSKSANIDC